MDRLSVACQALLVSLFCWLWPAPAQAGEEEPIQMLPSDLFQGADVLAGISLQPPGVDRDLRLRRPNNEIDFLLVVTTDRFGNALARAPLPDVPPGDYTAELVDGRTQVASTLVRVLAAPEIQLNPAQGVGGELVEVSIAGLPPGRVTLTVDGSPVIGPLAPEQGMLTGQFRVPRGGMAELPVLAESRVGNRVTGVSTASFQRLRTEQTDVQVGSADFPAGPHRRHTLRQLSGEVTLPDALNPQDLRWTLTLKPRDGDRVPVNVTPVQFTELPGKGRSKSYSFNADIVIPSVLSGFSAVDLAAETVGELVYQTPDTGESGPGVDLGGLLSQSQAALSAPLPAGIVPITNPVFDLDDDYGIAIEGRVVESGNTDDSTNGLMGIQVVVIGDTSFIPPFKIGADPIDILGQKAPGDTVAVSRSSAVQFENNQLTAAAVQLGILNATGSGCGKFFQVLETDGNGRYSFAFSPEVTNALNLIAAQTAETDKLIFQTGGGSGSGNPELPYQDRFTVKVNGLLSSPPYGVPASTLLNSFTGLTYAFERDPDSGLYFFCEPGTENCNDFFDPTEVLTSTLQPAPPLVAKTIETPLAIEGLSPPSEDQQVQVWQGLITFPSQGANPSLANATLRFKMDWDEINLGTPSATLTLDGIGSFPLQQLATQACVDGYAVYGADIPGLATVQGDITGQLNASSVSGDFVKAIRIETFPGPTWFEDPQRYQQPVSIVWSPSLVSITADEVPKSQDVSENINAVGLDTLDNENNVDAVVKQEFQIGSTNNQKRIADGQVTVLNNSGSVENKTLALGAGRTAFVHDSLLNFEVGGKTVREDLLARPEAPTFGDKESDILLSGWVPLARYAWGVPPIAAATFGIDFLYLVQLLNYGYVDITWNSVDVDSITEPASFLGLSVFFDFSVFAVVSATVSADPTIGVGMPIIIKDSQLVTSESEPCFEFELELRFKVSVGPCPLCISGSYSAVPVDVAKPSNCQIGKSKAEKGLAQFPTPDGLALASNGAGSAMALIVDDTGIKAQRILAGVPDSVEALASGPGAIKPAVSYFQQNAAVAVWSQSSLSATDYDLQVAADYDCSRADVQGDPLCDDQEGFDAYQHQHMVYATFDGGLWSLPTALTTPNTGEGGVSMAACPQSDLDCPMSGEVLAVWHRTLGDLDDREVRLVYAFFDGTSWTTPTILDASPGAHGQPSPVYVDGEPAIVWVYNSTPLTGAGGMRFDSRRLVYQFPRLNAGTQSVPNFPDSVASPSARARNGTIYLAYTSSAPGEPFIGTRRALFAATATSCQAGVCSWSTDKQQDLFGRDIFVEQPKLELNGAGQPMATYRWVGTGGLTVANDPFGTLGRGDTAISKIIPGQSQTEVLPVTNDGNINWQTQLVYDAGISSFLAVSAQFDEQLEQKTLEKLGFTRQPLGSVRRHKLASNRPVSLFEVPDAPDLVLKDARILGSSVVAGDDVIALQALLANSGLPLDPGVTVGIEAWWDGPPGVGELVGGAGGIDVSTAAGTEVLLEADVPSGVAIDELHRLQLVVNADGAIPESDGENNAFFLPLNRLPVPANVTWSTDLGGTTAFLAWDDPQDARVMAYRVYRRDGPSAAPIQAGVSPRLGFVDVMAVPGETYDYCVAALSENLMESDCSPWVTVPVKPLAGPVVFRNGFED